MKIFKTILTIAFIITISACSKDNYIIYESGPQEYGWATGTKGGEVWEASAYARWHTNDSSFIGITLETYSPYGALREHFSLNEIPIVGGLHDVKFGYSDLGDGFVGGILGMVADDGDVLVAGYDVNNAKEGFIELTEVDTINWVIKGNFEIYFVKNKGGGSYPDKVEVKNGAFEMGFYE